MKLRYLNVVFLVAVVALAVLAFRRGPRPAPFTYTEGTVIPLHQQAYIEPLELHIWQLTGSRRVDVLLGGGSEPKRVIASMVERSFQMWSFSGATGPAFAYEYGSPSYTLAYDAGYGLGRRLNTKSTAYEKRESATIAGRKATIYLATSTPSRAPAQYEETFWVDNETSRVLAHRLDLGDVPGSFYAEVTLTRPVKNEILPTKTFMLMEKTMGLDVDDIAVSSRSPYARQLSTEPTFPYFYNRPIGSTLSGEQVVPGADSYERRIHVETTGKEARVQVFRRSSQAIALPDGHLAGIGAQFATYAYAGTHLTIHEAMWSKELGAFEVVLESDSMTVNELLEYAASIRF